ncbi:hypothetical protein HYW99_03165 [Candidatus Woesearchaeota archaeon]|nr:hypothetical protein [Candidatus Woesearchaeota archaeon]
MGLRRDLVLHQKRTIESFRYVKEDISNLDAKIENLRNRLNSFDEGIISINNQLGSIQLSSEKCLSNINLQETTNKNFEAKIESTKEHLRNLDKEIKKVKNLVNRKISLMKKQNTELQKGLRIHSKTISKLNKKIDTKRIIQKTKSKRIVKPKKTVKKTIKKVITPEKTVIEVQQQGK